MKTSCFICNFSFSHTHINMYTLLFFQIKHLRVNWRDQGPLLLKCVSPWNNLTIIKFRKCSIDPIFYLVYSLYWMGLTFPVLNITTLVFTCAGFNPGPHTLHLVSISLSSPLICNDLSAFNSWFFLFFVFFFWWH